MKKSQGFSLIEVLISLLILSFILLGFDAMEVYALRENRNIYFLSVAENQLRSLKEKLQAYGSNINLSEQCRIWNSQNQILLPQGKGLILGAYPLYQLIIFWGEKTNNNDCEKRKKKNLYCLKRIVSL